MDLLIYRLRDIVCLSPAFFVHDQESFWIFSLALYFPAFPQKWGSLRYRRCFSSKSVYIYV